MNKSEKEMEANSGGDYQLPSSTLAFTSMGEDVKYYIMEASHQLEDSGEQNMTCSIDPATGNLILHHEGNTSTSNAEENISGAEFTVNPSAFNGPNFDYRRSESLTLSEHGHDYSQYAAVATEGPYMYQSMTLAPEIGNEYQAEQEEEDQLSEIRVSNVTSIADIKVEESNSLDQGDSNSLKVLLWSNRKTEDLIQCIHRHERKFSNASRARTHIWNEISKDMAELGHLDCDRDDCNKKWSNLYRTWKKVKSRPRATGSRWPFYGLVTELVKTLGARIREYRDKVEAPSKEYISRKSKDLVSKLLKNNLAYQEAVKLAEEKFEKQAEKLNIERDNILKDIKQVLESGYAKPETCQTIESQLQNIMNARTMEQHNGEETESGSHGPDNLTMITVEDSNRSNSSIPILFLNISNDFGQDNMEYQLVEINPATNGVIGVSSDTFQLCVPSSSAGTSLSSQMSDTSGSCRKPSQ
ncbi:unnamed protein product [Orchesella dallaii]|uniref:Myb/SANT-like DNA-binding domain-containing protein n=1 Tax=Orchesella dallaii TaxID=48710 RepID=A0ABP1Q8P2_9HEXA